KHVVEDVYGRKPPTTFRYDFIGIKGTPGKMSSSKGKVVDLYDLLRVYTPELARYLFAGTRPNTEFTISFDLDVIKIYEDYDRTERIYWGTEQAKDEETRSRERRIYELSQVDEVPAKMPYQVAFRHLCSLLQINLGDVEKTLAQLPGVEEHQLDRLRVRAKCAWTWITESAPDEFRWALREDGSAIEANEEERAALVELRETVRAGGLDEQALGTKIFDIAKAHGLEPKDFFKVTYRALIDRDRGPRLAGFILEVGAERIVKILSAY
ncbi:MAG TPA: lysine--tRNA ligase, partial [Spirochaetales bacterium]|nr:lysine--tRNA ligase [Spirochaetales bacterium]